MRKPFPRPLATPMLEIHVAHEKWNYRSNAFSAHHASLRGLTVSNEAVSKKNNTKEQGLLENDYQYNNDTDQFENSRLETRRAFIL